MKSIIIDMREISLSKEVYDKEPRLFFTIFIYCLLVFVLISCVWMYFGRIDIIIRAQGIIRPHGVTATVINPASGFVSKVSFYDGQQVSRGDILYVISNLNPISTDTQVDEFVVRASIDGEVSVATELVDDNYVMGGTHILSIIPARGNILNAHIFINNNDIGRITEGMMVNYLIAALPHQNFEKISGYITRIASDSSSNQYAQGYFLVESEIEDKLYYDKQGNNVTLRVGMVFEAQIVLERQRILFYLLDMLNLRY